MKRSLHKETKLIVKFQGSLGHTIVDHYGKVPACGPVSVVRPKVLVFRDSFFSALEPFFMHSNVDMVTHHSNWDFIEIERQITIEKPDVVIFEKVERYIVD